MKIAVWHDLPSGGGKRALYDHVAGLLSRGHSVEAWCTPSADQAFLPLSDLVPEHTVPMDSRQPGNLRGMVDRASGRSLAIRRTLHAIDHHSRLCASQIIEAGCDVLLAGSSVHVGAAPIGRHTPLPSILYLQEPHRYLYEALPRLPWVAPDRENSFRSGVAPLARRTANALKISALRVQAREELSNVRAFTRVLVNSFFSRESVLRSFGVDATVCQLGVDTSRFYDRGEPRENMVLGIGAFAPHKRVDVAVETIAQLRVPRPRLVWIANTFDSAYLSHVVSLATKYRLDFEPRINTSHQELFDLLNLARAMIYAPRLEPFGYAPLEAAACGVPVVSVAEGGIRESVINDYTGLLVGSDEDLVTALQRLLDDEELREAMRKAARRNVTIRWSLTEAVSRIEQQLLSVI